MTDNTSPTNGTNLSELARVLYEQNRGKVGRPWEHTNAATREKWQVRAAKAAAEHAVAIAQPKPPGTRKYELGAVPLDLGSSHEVELQLPRGAVVRMITIMMREQRIALQAKPVAIPTLVIEVDPDEALEVRRFALLRAGGRIETHHEMWFVGATLDPTENGRPICVYEVKQVMTNEMAGDADAGLRADRVIVDDPHDVTDDRQPG